MRSGKDSGLVRLASHKYFGNPYTQKMHVQQEKCTLEHYLSRVAAECNGLKLVCAVQSTCITC
jgi:hypothetical protein